MCGIAGYSVAPESTVSRTLAAQALLTGIADRGSDAAGYAFRSPGGETHVVRQRTGASGLLETVRVPDSAAQALIHVRDYTKGHPDIDVNNHPIRHGPVVGIHNGIIENDDATLARHGIERADPAMTVDSEVIFALVARYGHGKGRVLEELRGSMATAWIDERYPGSLYLARGLGRPLWIGRGRHELFFASTEATLELVEEYAGVRLDIEEIAEGRLLEAVDGRLRRPHRFDPDRSFERADPPAVKAPEERATCLARLAVLAATA